MKTKYTDIVNEQAIGRVDNPIKMNDLLKLAEGEKLKPSATDAKSVLFIGIDFQQDFMDAGALGVAGAAADVSRATKWMYANMEKITEVAVSIDTHIPQQIFHACWWIDKDGNNPPPFTAITLADYDAGKWRAVISPIKSRNYLENLEKNSKNVLVIWPYHCLKGTTGCALDNQFMNMVYFHSVARNSIGPKLVKGENPYSEMYGIIKPEYDERGFINLDFLNRLEKHDMIVIAGEAASHCVLSSLKQIVEHYASKPEVTKKIYVLEDCMSFIPRFESAKAEYSALKSKYGVNLVNSTSFTI